MALVVAEDREGVERGKGWVVWRGSMCVENESIEEGGQLGIPLDNEILLGEESRKLYLRSVEHGIQTYNLQTPPSPFIAFINPLTSPKSSPFPFL